MFNLFGGLINVIATATANGACKVEPSFFGLVPWYHYLDVGLDAQGKCTVVSFTVVNGATPSDIPLVLLAIVDDLLRIAGIVAVGFVIYGAIQFVVSQGEPDKTTKARMTIMNSLIGLAIALVAVGAVSYVGGKLGVN